MLQEYNIKVSHIRGTDNGIAHALTVNTLFHLLCCRLVVVILEMTFTNKYKFMTELKN